MPALFLLLARGRHLYRFPSSGRWLFNIPAERLEEGVEELPSQLGFVVAVGT